MSDILISGSGGFVGTNLSEYLTNLAHNVTALTRNNVDRESTSWNNLDKIQNLGFDAIIHLAGKAHDTKGTSEATEYFAINTDLTISLFNTFLRSDIPDFIYFSTVKAAADTVDNMLFENVAPDPKTPYGQSKQKAEQYLIAQKLPPGKRLIILRPCMIHGPGNKGNLNLLYNFVKKGMPYPLAAFSNQRSFLSIKNLNFIVEKLISDPAIPGGIYNMADDEQLSTNEVIDIIAKTSGLKPRLWKLNKRLIELMALTGDKLHLPLNTERLKKLTESYIVSNAKIKNALHINKLPVSTTEGLEITIKSFSAH